ncbi:MAG: UMP kinase [Candidatus Aenigmarchaeota archaeon]|nr:UMP kinase [Candidatus Aenigmarchaeota archaeon]
MRIVFDMGGSIICPEGTPDINFVKKFSKFLIGLKKKRHGIIIVTGGGRVAKNYIKAAREFKPDEDILDSIGILGTRMNANVIISALGKHAYRNVAETREDLEHGINSGKIVVMGGTVPGQTTDAVSVAAAQFFSAKMIIIGTDVKGIYDKDPDKYKNAKLLKKISAKKLFKMVNVKKHTAGPLTIMDPVAAKLLCKNKIKTVVLNGRDLANIQKAIKNERFVGSVIE